MRNIGERIKAIREQLNMTQAQLAEKVGVVRSHIAKIENNDTNGSLDVLQRLATALGVPVAKLLEEESSAQASGE